MLYIHSTPNIVACLFGIAGLYFFFSGTIANNWLFIIIGLYSIGYRLSPKPPKIKIKNKSRLSSDELLFSLNKLIDKVDNKLPTSVLKLLGGIQEKLSYVIENMDDIDNANTKFVINQTVVDYLPRILNTYLKIPPAYSKLHKLNNGMTAIDLVTDQLVLLDNQIYSISEAIAHQTIKDLNIHHRFLNERFVSNVDEWLV